MEVSVVASAVTAAAVIIGGGVTSLVNYKILKKSLEGKLASDIVLADKARVHEEIDKYISRVERAHKILSVVDREFSRTGLHIRWAAGTTENDYHGIYLNVCDQADELGIIADFHLPDIASDVRLLNGKMNVFWGSFQGVLYQTNKGTSIHEIAKDSDFETSCKIAEEIEDLTGQLKSSLIRLSRDFRVQREKRVWDALHHLIK